MNNDLYSIIIPTMWKSPKLIQMLELYENSNYVYEIILLDNDPDRKIDLSRFKKILYYTEQKNLFVNPSWNIGYTLSKKKLIIANDDIFLDKLDEVLKLFSKCEFDIVGISLGGDNGEMKIEQITNFPQDSYGCFMFVKDYKYIPEKYKIWYGDNFLFQNSKKRGILKNSGLITNVSETLNSEDLLYGRQMTQIETNIFKSQGFVINRTSQNKLLAVLVNYGDEQLNYLRNVIDGLKSFKNYDVTIIVNSNIHLNIPNIDSVNIFNNLNDYKLLPLTCRKTILDNIEKYDIFIYGENDQLFNETHIDRHLEYSEILPPDRISGLLRYEKNDDGIFYPDYHAEYDWDFNSVEIHNGKKFAHFTNLHQGSFILTKKQLNQIVANHDFTKFLGESKYDEMCKVCTDIYEFCGFKKMICLSDFKENLIHHLPNVYIDGIKGRNKNQRSDSKRMNDSLIKLMSTTIPFKINGFYLNLDRRPDRKTQMELELLKTNHNIQRYPAIDGNNLKSLNGFRGFIPKSEKKQYATYLSHLNMIKLAKQNGWDKVIILEDDVTLCDDFDERLNLYLNSLPDNWEIAYIGFTETPNTKLTKISKYIHRVNEVFGCWGMVINSKIYDFLIKTIEDKNTIIDWITKDYIQTRMNCYVFIPFFGYVNNGYSDLWNTHMEFGMIQKYYQNNLLDITIERHKLVDYSEYKESNLDKLKKLMNLSEKKPIEIDYNSINYVLSKKDNFYKTNSSLKPLRENIPQNRNEITQLKKDSLVKTSRDLFNKGKKYKG